MLISFDGLDSSGKATQSRLLYEHLQNRGIRTEKFCTPDYTTPSGKELKMRLQNKLGNWQQTPWQEKMGFFAANRKEHKEEVQRALQEGAVVIYDRYVPSSIVFMIEEAASEEARQTREEVRRKVMQLEYEENGMPQEDISIFLDIPPYIAIDLLEGRKVHRGDEDEQTDHMHVQEALYAEYIRIAEEYPEKTLHIRCMEGDRLRGIQEIESLVRQELAARFPEHTNYFL